MSPAEPGLGLQMGEGDAPGGGALCTLRGWEGALGHC